jgi:DNA-binding beta-propeller fold protein YncE
MRLHRDRRRAAVLRLTLVLALSAHQGGVGGGVVSATATTGAGRASVAERSRARARLVWPAPPAVARIRFVRTIDPASVAGPPSFMKKVWRALVGAPDEAHMNQPYGIAVGADGKVYVADTFGGIVLVYDLAKSAYATINVKGRSLIGIAADAGHLYVTDSVAGSVTGLDHKGRTLWTIGRRFGLGRPTGIVWAGDRLYVVDTLHHNVFMLSPAGAYLGAFGMHGSGPGQFNFPTNIARDRDGRLYVTDTMNFRVQMFDAEGEFLGAFGRPGDGAGDFDKPKGVALDSAGHIYVVEGLSDVVQIFDRTGRLLLAFAGSGSGEGQLWLPTGITIVDDLVYVADSANRRVQVFEYLRANR